MGWGTGEPLGWDCRWETDKLGCCPDRPGRSKRLLRKGTGFRGMEVREMEGLRQKSAREDEEEGGVRHDSLVSAWAVGGVGTERRSVGGEDEGTVEGFSFRSVSHGPVRCSDGGVGRCLKIRICSSEEKPGVEKESSELSDHWSSKWSWPGTEIRVREIGAKTENLGNRADRMCRNAETSRVLRRNHSRAKRQTRGDSCPERPGRGTSVPQDQEGDPGSRVLRIRQVGRRPRPPVLLWSEVWELKEWRPRWRWQSSLGAWCLAWYFVQKRVT